MVYEEGVVEQIALDLSGAVPTGKVLRRHDLGSRAEGCVADDRTGTLYVAEDKVAHWRIDTDPARAMTPQRFAAAAGVRPHRDGDGLATLPRGRARDPKGVGLGQSVAIGWVHSRRRYL